MEKKRNFHLFPSATIDERREGYVISLKFLFSIRDARPDLALSASEIENVLLTAEQLLKAM